MHIRRCWGDESEGQGAAARQDLCLRLRNRLVSLLLLAIVGAPGCSVYVNPDQRTVVRILKRSAVPATMEEQPRHDPRRFNVLEMRKGEVENGDGDLALPEYSRA